MSCCIWMGWFPAFNETVTQLQMSYLPLISRAHSGVHFHNGHCLLPWRPFRYLTSSVDFWPHNQEWFACRSTSIQPRRELLFLTWKRIWICESVPGKRVCEIMLRAPFYSQPFLPLALNFHISIFNLFWRIVRTFLDVYSFQLPGTILSWVAFQETVEHIFLFPP